MRLFFKYMPSPVGVLRLVAHDQALVAVLWENENPKRVRLAELVEHNQHPILLETEKQLSEYFAAKRQSFDLPLDFSGTDFQKQVWQALLQIPFGETRSYKDIALQIGNLKPFVQWVRLMAKIQFQLLCRVIGLWGRMENWSALQAVWTIKIFY